MARSRQRSQVLSRMACSFNSPSSLRRTICRFFMFSKLRNYLCRFWCETLRTAIYDRNLYSSNKYPEAVYTVGCEESHGDDFAEISPDWPIRGSGMIITIVKQVPWYNLNWPGSHHDVVLFEYLFGHFSRRDHQIFDGAEAQVHERAVLFRGLVERSVWQLPQQCKASKKRPP